MRWALAACALAAACGHISFDPEPGASVFTPVPLPPASVVNGAVVDTTPGTVYELLHPREAFRSDDGGATWTPCANVTAEQLVVDSDGTLYLAATDDVYVSTDRCATFQPLALGMYTFAIARAGSRLYAGTDTGLYVYDGASWSAVATPLGATHVNAIAANGSTILVGYLTGVARSIDGGTTWTVQNTGLGTVDVVAIAFAPSNPAIVYASDGGNLDRSDDGGATWKVLYNIGASGLAVAPNDPTYVIIADFTDLLLTQNSGTTFTGVRTPIMEDAQPRAVAFDGAGGVYVGTARGMFYATLPALDWQPRFGDVDAWTMRGFASSGADVYWATDAGVLHSSDGGHSYTLATNGFVITSQSYATVVPPGNDAAVLACGGEIRASTDRAATFTIAYTTGGPDKFLVQHLAAAGSRVFGATHTRVIFADPPWTSWSATQLGGQPHDVLAVAVAPDGTIVAAADVGIFESSDNGLTFQALPGAPPDARHVWFASDGTLLVGTSDGLWSYSSGWTQLGLAGMEPTSLLVNATGWVAATKQDVYASHDLGATWKVVPGLARQWPRTLGIDGSGNLLVGTLGYGLFTTPYP